MVEKRKNTYRNLVLNMSLILISIMNGITFINFNEYPSSIFIPIITCLFFPVIAALIFLINEVKQAIVYLLIDIFITAIFIHNTFILLIVFLFTIAIGIIIGYMIKSKKNIGISTFVISISYIIFQVIMAMLYIKVVLNTTLNGYAENIKEGFKLSFENIQEELSSMPSLNSDMLNDIKPIFDQVTSGLDDFFIGFPTVILFSCIIAAVVYYLATNKIMKLLKVEGLRIKVFSCWYISNLLIATLILLACFGIILNENGSIIGEIIYINARFILEILLILNGIAFGYYFLIWKVKQPKIYAIILMIMATITFQSFVISIGFIEVILDLRKLDPHRIFKKKSEQK